MYKLLQSSAFKTWIEDLRDRKAKRVIAVRLGRLQEGLFGDAKAVGDGVREARIHFGPGYRVYFQVRGNEIILLLCGGDKSTQSADIVRAKAGAKAWKD